MYKRCRQTCPRQVQITHLQRRRTDEKEKKRETKEKIESGSNGEITTLALLRNREGSARCGWYIDSDLRA